MDPVSKAAWEDRRRAFEAYERWIARNWREDPSQAFEWLEEMYTLIRRVGLAGDEDSAAPDVLERRRRVRRVLAHLRA